MRMSESVKSLAEAVSEFQSGLTTLKPDSQNPHLKNKFASLPAMWAHVREGLHKNGLSVSQFVSAGDVGPTVTTVLLHKSGEWIRDGYTMPMSKAHGGVNDAQRTGIAISYAKRYAFQAVLGITVSEEDIDGEMGEATSNSGAGEFKRSAGLLDEFSKVIRAMTAKPQVDNWLAKYKPLVVAGLMPQHQKVLTADIKGKYAEIETNRQKTSAPKDEPAQPELPSGHDGNPDDQDYPF